MLPPGWMAMKATFVLPPLLLCAVSYTIFRDEFFSKHITLSLLVCFCFLLPWFVVILSGICVFRRKPYAEIRLTDELRDCDLEVENENVIKPLDHRIFNRFRQFFKNIYGLCVFRPAYGILFAVGVVGLLTSLHLLTTYDVGIKDPKVKADFNSACTHLFLPSLVLMSVVILIANSGIYASTPNCELHSYHPFQEFVEMPMSVLFGRTFAAMMNVGSLNIFYGLLLFVYVMVAVNFLDHIKNSPEKTIDEVQATMSKMPPIEFLLSALTVFSIAAGFFLLVHMILSAYVQAKRCTLAIIERNWRRNMRAIEYLLPDVSFKSLEDLQEALDAKRIKALSDNEKVAFDYIAMPLWQTRRPFVDMTVPARQENVPPSPEQLADVEERLSQLSSSDKSDQEQDENPEGRTDEQKAEEASSATKVTRRHSRQFSFGNIIPAKITKRRQEIVQDPIAEEEISENYESNADDVPEDESSRNPTLQEEGQGTPKPEPTRVTRRREYYD